ncbi:MAG: hypothetical protein KJO54_02195 [Gammaproteobacteria bacterium]|nr:hypothetical protein [Gammaproteobacteria bacterium]
MAKKTGLTPIFFLAVFMACPVHSLAQAIPVELKQTDKGWQLYRGGEPYFIRGAGGDGALEQLAAAGGNSIRTWGAGDLDARLDAAHALGISVTVGIWLGHERHGFDYNDPEQVRQQLATAREAVLRYRDHPALLLWGIGNEMEGFESGDNPAIWQAVNEVAAMVRELDPHHPTMTVTAEIGGGRIRAVNDAPAIDLHGINSYGGAPSLPERYRAGGGTKPYVITEFGHPGTWEIPKNEWGAPHELTSTQKADYYRRSYRQGVLDAPGLALGSYAFVWGYKMEATATWFGMFLPDGSRLGAIDVLTELWSGKPPADRAPLVEPLVVDGSPQVKPGARVSVKAAVSDPEGGVLQAHWALRAESDEYMTGGDFRPMLPDIEGALLEGDSGGAVLRMPQDPGPYRLFLYVKDEAGNAGTANVPLLVKGKVRTRFPVYVYHDSLEGMPWVPSGWMGATDALTMDGDHTDNCHDGSACIRIHFDGPAGWAGIAWQHPPNNWGDMEGGFDLSGAKYLELWARGEYGAEKMNIGVGLVEKDKPYPDSGKKSVDGIVLGSEWKRYRIKVSRLDMSSIKTGFVIVFSGARRPFTIYLDSIRFVR